MTTLRATLEDDYACALGLAWLGLSGNVHLLRHLKDAGVQGVWNASRPRLLSWGLGERAIRPFLEARASFDPSRAQAILTTTRQWFVPFGAPLYPPELLQLEFPPAGVFARGSREAMELLMGVPRLTVVGTRRATAEGMEAARAFVGTLSKRGIAVLSGLALGIDAQAHKVALENRGITLAVLGCGADVVYPPRHHWLYDRIVAAGLVISELPPGSHPTKWTFPHRNRLLAALGDAVLVVEGNATSGAMQTAKWALELGRTVFSVPGSIFREGSEGCNALISDGATPALRPDCLVEDFLEATRMQRGERGPSKSVRAAIGEQILLQGAAVTPGPKALVFEWLKKGPGSVDGLVAATGLSAREVSAALGELEVRGAVVRAGPGMFLRAP